MAKIKVLRIINRFNIGGPTYNATFLTCFLGNEFETLLVGGLPEPGESDSLHIPRSYGLEPTLLPELQRIPNFKSDRAAYKKLRQLIEEFQPDIVHTHAAKAGALGRRAAFAAGVPVVVHTFHGHVFHSYFGKIKTWIFKMIERRLAARSTGIIAISEIQKKELSQIHRICKADKITVIPLGFDLNKFRLNRDENRIAVRKEYQLLDDEVAVAIIGRLAPVKNHDFFFDVLEELLSKGISKMRVFVVGDGETRALVEKRAQDLNARFEANIVLTSWIHDIARFNAGMDVICLTSDNEGTPVSLIEAQASDLVVLTTDVGGVRDIMIDGETGFVVEKGNLKEYTEKLRILVENHEIRRKMSQNGWNYVRDKFHYTRLVTDMEQYYKKLLAESKRK